ncbi:MAG: polysaccharide deacetylase family protein [bacterium]|nr:polysaccharide deacetylase family protein [bacterium]
MKMLVLVPKVTGRVMYAMELLLGQLLGLEFDCTVDAEQFNAYEGPKMQYGSQRQGEAPFVKAVDLLFERHIHEQSFRTVDFEGTVAPYAVYGQGNLLPFDVFAASFFLVSRYEEYLSQVRDQYGRFRAESTWMFENDMLQKPLVDIWTLALGSRLQAVYPDLPIKKRKFTFIPTYDVDAAWAYKSKGVYRTLGGFIKDLSSGDRERIRERHQVLRGKRKDPFDSFEFQFELQKEFKLKPIYFILCGEYDTNDKNISIRKAAFRSLIKTLGDHADVGIHPSFSSYLDIDKLRKEINSLSEVLHRPLTKSRQHFLRMNLPRSYQKLIELDISDDYTMGFASQAGFRAGIADSFRFYDLENDMVTNLRVHPFALMDGTMRDYLNLDLEASYALTTQLIDEVKAVGGTFIYLTHNETLGGVQRWVGWPEMYRRMLEYITKAPEPVEGQI